MLPRLLRGGLLGLAVVPAAGAVLMLVLPALGFLPGLSPYAGPSSPIPDLLWREPALLTSLLQNLWIGLAATLVSTAGALLLLAAKAADSRAGAARWPLPGLLALPHAAATLSAVLLLSPSGLIFRILHGLTGAFAQPPDWSLMRDRYGVMLIAVLAFKELPFLYFLGLAALPGLPVRDSRMQMTGLGYGVFSGFLLSLGPGLYRRLRLPVLIVLAYAISVTDMPLLIGPDLPPPLSVRSLEWLGDADLQHRYTAAAAALLLVATILAGLLLWRLVEAVTAFCARGLLEGGWRLAGDRALQWVSTGLLAAILIFSAASYSVLALWSLARSWTYPSLLPTTFTVDNWAYALQTLGTPLLTTMALGATAAILSLFVSIALLWIEDRQDARRTQARLVFLPLLLPQVAIVSGLQMGALFLGATPGFGLLLLSHLIFVFPYVHLALSGPWHGLDRRYDRLAETLGKGALAILLTVRLPLLLAALSTALAIGFAVSTGLFLPTAVLGQGRITTVVTEAVALGSGGDRRLIGTYALLQAAMVLGTFAAAGALPALRWRHRRGMRE